MLFVITSRKRPELDLEDFLGNVAFSVVPKALFSTDGEPLLCTNKVKLLHHIQELGKLHQQNDIDAVDENEMEVLVIDGMAVLNQIHKCNEMKACKVLNCYCDIVL